MRRNCGHEKRQAHYELERALEAFVGGRFVITSRVRRHMAVHDWTENYIIDCLSGLSSSDFHKSQAHRVHGGIWLDVYRPVMGSQRLYLKFTQQHDGDGFILLSFCVDGEDH